MARTPFKRSDRVASLLREALSELIRFQLRDPRVRRVDLTDVEVSSDLCEAKIFYYCVADEAERLKVEEGLKRAKGFLRRELARRVALRRIPDLRFYYDESINYGERIEARLRELGLGGEQGEGKDLSEDA